MQILVNGELFEAAPAATVAALVSALKLEGQRLAVELNGDILPRSEWPARTLGVSDRIEIVRAIGGG